MTGPTTRQARARRGHRIGGSYGAQQPPPPIPTGWRRQATYTSEQVCHLAGITYRQLDYWSSTGLLDPERRGIGTAPRHRSGPGYSRIWDEAGLVRVRAIARMLALGLSLQRIRRLINDGNHVVFQVLPLPTTLDEEPHD